MLEVILPIAILALMLVFVDQMRRLLAHAILNGTIRKAIEKDPASVPLLVGQLEQGRSSAGMLVGVILLVGGVALGVAGLFEESGERIDVFQIAAIAAVLGAGAITYKLVQGRNKPRE